MAKKAKIEIADESIRESFARLSRLQPKALAYAHKAMFRACANKLKNTTQKNIRAVLSNANAKSERFPTMTPPGKGVLTKIGSKGGYAVVSINNRNSFLLRIFEKGTPLRYIMGKKTSAVTKTRRRYRVPGAHRGKIEAMKFFEKSIKEANPDIKRIQEEAFVKNVTRQWKKAGN